jgi:FdhD protein
LEPVVLVGSGKSKLNVIFADSRATHAPVETIAFRGGVAVRQSRSVAEEVAIAFSYGGSSHAVMMATPDDLVDFAVGFSLSEGLIDDASQIEAIEIVRDEMGIDVQLSLVEDVDEKLRARRRHMMGPVGCGLCGIESLEQAVRAVRPVVSSTLTITPGEIASAVAALSEQQQLNQITRAVHGAGFFVPDQGLVLVREDVGRHNALDKLCGAVVASGLAGSSGVVTVTSRLSIEMIQKAGMLGSPIIIAISAPTAYAVRAADEAGMTMVAVARGADFEIFTHAHRVIF